MCPTAPTPHVIGPPDSAPEPDVAHAVQIAPRVWWVGELLEGDEFQCHAYLVEQGDESVLIDAGAAPSFRHVLAKVEEVVPLASIRWFVVHHPDPDITGCLPLLDQLVTRPDAAVVTHWRAEALLKHYGLDLPFWRVEEHGWALPLEDRTLQFVLTPYLHFPGAFVTFDPASGTLFSSDLFGAFTPEPRLHVQDERYFEGMRLFHEHYMPSQEILQHGLAELEPLPIQRIAPQHGGVIPEALVRPAMAFLDKVECGLYLSSKHDHDVRRMSAVNRALRQAVRLLTVTHQLPELVQGLTEIVQDVLPVRDIQLYGSWADGLMLLDSATRFRGVPAALPNHLAPWMGICRDRWSPATSFITDPEGAPLVALPLFSMEGECARHLAVLELSAPIEADALAVHILEELSTPLEVALDREMLLREVQQRRQELYELATRDALTGLYNRHYFHGAAARMAALQDRGRGGTLVVSMLDIDRFKDINDTFGHAAGDIVLARLALALQETIREEDLAVRMGGEEIAVFHLHHPHTDHEEELAERIRQATEALDFGPLLGGRKITLSGGVAARRPRESLDSVLERADQALYAAKEAGRNRVMVAAELEAEQLPNAVGHPLRRPSQVGAPLRGGMAALRPPSRFRVPRRGGVE